MATPKSKKMTRDKFLELNGDIVMSRRDFISHCRRRGLYLSDDHLAWYEKQGLIKPIFVIHKHPIYVPQQAYMINKIEQVRLYNLEGSGDRTWRQAIKDNLEMLKDDAAKFESILNLILRIRHYYVRDIDLYFHCGKMTMISNDLVIYYGSYANRDIPSADWGKKLDKDKLKFQARKTFDESGFSETELRDWSEQFAWAGRDVDPLKDSYWHAFLENIRQASTRKMDFLLGGALMAQDFYRLADLLSIFLEDALKKCHLISPFDAFDLSGGSWRKGRCASCQKIFNATNYAQKFCPDCQKEATKNSEAAWRCSGCDAELIKWADGNLLVENFIKRSQGKINVKGNVNTQIKLVYGGLQVKMDCPCGAHNVRFIESGWM